MRFSVKLPGHTHFEVSPSVACTPWVTVDLGGTVWFVAQVALGPKDLGLKPGSDTY